MTNEPPDSRSVRAPSTAEYSFDPAAGATTAAPTSRLSTGLVAIIALALIAIIGGGVGLVALRSGSADTEAMPADEASSGDRGEAGSVDGVPAATVDTTGQATSAPETATPETATPDATATDETAPDLTAPDLTAPGVTTVPEAALPEPTAPPTPAPPPAAPSPAQVGAPVIAASVTRPGGLDSCTPPNVTSYGADLASDGLTSTAWMAPGDGVGQRLVFTFPSPVTISEVGLFPGYGKFDPCTADDRFFQLRRVGSVQWSFDDGSAVDQTFTPEKVVQLIQVAPRTTRSITITIVTTIAPGVARLDHTPISEVVIS